MDYGLILNKFKVLTLFKHDLIAVMVSICYFKFQDQMTWTIVHRLVRVNRYAKSSFHMKHIYCRFSDFANFTSTAIFSFMKV